MMRITLKCFFVLRSFLLLSLVSMSMIHAQQNEIPIGTWQGTLKVSGMELRIVFHITQTEDGNLTATMDSPDQGAKDIPVSKVTYHSGHIIMEVAAIRGEYEGTLSGDKTHINGEWRQSGIRLPLNLQKTEKAIEIRRPQEPTPPYPYSEEEVVFSNESAGITLAGTLTFPKSETPLPAVVLVSGSGPQDRDETIMGHRPFWVLADYLTRRGIAVLRYDDRGVGKSGGDFSTATMSDFISDALAGIAYLKTRNEIDPHKIGIIGHSEGGWIAPEIATRSRDVAFIVLMAAPGITGEELLILQNTALMKASGIDKALITKTIQSSRAMFSIVKNVHDSKEAEKRLRRLHKTFMDGLSDEQKQAYQQFGGPDTLFEAQLTMLLSPWFRQLLSYDPRPFLQKVTCLVLAITGEKDLQVPSRVNLSQIETALKEGGNKQFVIKELPGLNHLFQSAETGLPGEYAKIEETISPVALKTIGDWIVKVTKDSRQ